MSRTYRKNIRCFCCYGDNREFYQIRRRQRRHRTNHEVRNLLANYGPEGLDERWKGADMTREDQWMEPTDGHWAENRESLKRGMRYFGRPGFEYAHMKQFDYYLKSKNRKHYRIV